MYDQEIYRYRGMPSYRRLKTMVRRRVDQMIRTRNFKARNERIETGVLVKSRKREKCHRGGLWEETFSGMQLDGVQEETLVVSATETIVHRKYYRPLLLQKTDGRKPSKGFCLRGESPS